MEKLIFNNSIGDSIELSNTAPFLLQRIEGLGSPQVIDITSRGVGQDGSTYHDNILEPRDISIEMAILANLDVELFQLRRKLNKIFNPKLGEGILRYINDYGTWDIKIAPLQAPVEGEKFGASQELLLNLKAHNPYWRNIRESKTEIALWVGTLEFPIDIPPSGMEFGHRVSNLIANIYNEGDVACGMRIEFRALASVVKPSLINVNTGEYIKMKMTLEKKDKLIIVTTKGQKKIELIRDNIVYDAGGQYDLSSTFFQLDVGDNRIKYDAEEGIDNLEVSIYYRQLYSGV